MAKENREDSYLGNRLLKPTNVPQQFTKHEVEEYVKCRDDIVYFLKHYVKVIHVDKGLVPFDLYDYQQDLIDTLDNNRYVIVKSARQSGKSVTSLGYILHYVLFNQTKIVGILANKAATSRELLGRLQTAYQHLPKFLQQGIVEWNKGNMELENGSKIIASSTSSSAIRGYSFSMLFLDEFAFVPRTIADAFIKSVYPDKSNRIVKRYFRGSVSKQILPLSLNFLSPGQRAWFDLVLALESDPRVLIQDNFATLFDNDMEFIARKELKRMNKDLGTTVILSSINDHALKKLCSVLVYLENGHITKVRSGQLKKQRGGYSKK